MPRTLAPTDLRAPGGTVAGATFSPDGKLVLVTAGVDGEALGPDAPGRSSLELPNVAGVSAELSPDGSRLVIAGDALLEVLPCFACAPLGELEQHARSLLPPTTISAGRTWPGSGSPSRPAGSSC